MVRFPDLRIGQETPAGGQSWYGLNFFAGACAIPALLFILNPVLEIGLRASSFCIFGLAVLGAARSLFRMKRMAGLPSPWLLAHPIIVFPVLLAAEIGLRGGLIYLPLAGDELAAWLYSSKMFFSADTWWTSEMSYRLGPYTIGWPLTMVFPSLLIGTFNEGYAASIPFIFHVGLLGALYDVLKNRCELVAGERDGVSGIGWPWLGVLSVLTLEATYRLFPNFLLIEKPQIYVICILLLAGMAGQFDGVRRRHLALNMGIVFAAGYLFKVALITFAAAMFLFLVAFVWRDKKTGTGVSSARGFVGVSGIYSILLFLPFVLVYVVWGEVLKAHDIGNGCLGSPATFAINALTALVSGEATSYFFSFWREIGVYVGEFKLPVTVLSLIGIGMLPLMRGGVWVMLAFLGFAAAYAASLYLAYSACFSGFEAETFASIQRYSRVLIRCLHFFGIAILGVLFFERIRGLFGGRVYPWTRNYLGRGVTLFAVGILAAWQAIQLDRSVDDISTRQNEEPRWVSRMLTMRTEALALNRVLEDRNLGDQRTRIIYQGMGDLEWRVARYHSVNVNGDRPMYRYRLESGWRIAPEQADIWTKKLSTGDARTYLAGMDVIWPTVLDDWMTGILRGMVDPADCETDLTKSFLLKSAASPTRFDCVPKEGGPGAGDIGPSHN